MSVKIYDKSQNKWVIFPGTMGAPGKDAYIIAQENGYTGTKEEYNQILANIPQVVEFIENADKIPTQGSNNLVQSGGTWQAIKDVKDQVDTLTSSITNDINEIKITEIPNQIKASIIDNLDSSAVDKSLSANQGRILKEMISNLVNLRLQIVAELPERGETNIIYLIQKDGEAPDTYDEYVYIEDKWEKIGNTDVDLSNYYTKEDVYNKSEINEIKSQIESQISDVEVSNSGSGNVITSLEVDPVNKHKINVTKDIDVYTKSEIDSKLSDSGLGDVIAAAEFTTENRVIVSNGAGKVVKDSGVLIENLALKSYVDEKEIAWDKVTGKPETYAPSEHKHNIADINDFPEIPDPIQVDSELSSSSENPVQNKVIEAALKNKLDSTALENYYNKEEIDSKISAAGGGDVVASGELVANNLIIGAGSKSIKDSGTSLTSLATKQELSKPTTFNWTNGTTEGPTGSLTGDNMSSVAYPAIPSASESQSGVVTTDTQKFKGNKEFLDKVAINNSTFLEVDRIETYSPGGTLQIGSNLGEGPGSIILGTDGVFNGKGDEYSGTAATAKKVSNKLIFTGAVTGEYDGSSELSINIPEGGNGEIPIALPNPYSLSITANSQKTTYDGSSAVNLNLDSIFSKKLPILTNPEDAGKPGIFFTTDGETTVNITARVTKDQPTAIVVVPGTTPVILDELTVYAMQDMTFTEPVDCSYKCFCISWIAEAQSGLREDLILVNGAMYG